MGTLAGEGEELQISVAAPHINAPLPAYPLKEHTYASLGTAAFFLPLELCLVFVDQRYQRSKRNASIHYPPER